MDTITNLTRIEEIMYKALQNSAKAFSTFVNKDVTISNFNTDLLEEHQSFATDWGDSIILISDLKGKLAGKSYLVFTVDQANEFCLQCLPLHLQENTEMKEAVLLEFDNIVTAAVVKVLSEHLHIHCYAYVPSIYYMKGQDFQTRLNDDFNGSVFIQTQATFFLSDWEFDILFIWAFAESILRYDQL